MDISVVIVSYNNAAHIKDCISSVLCEVEGLSWEIILVDNNSTDRTVSIVEGLAELSHPGRIELIKNTGNFGFTSALNQGFSISSGDTLLVLNPDTEIRRGALRELMTGADQRGRNCVLAPQLQNADGSIQPSCRRFPRRSDVLYEVLCLGRLFHRSKRFNRWKMGDFDHRTTRLVDQPQGACLLFSRQLLNAVGLWDEDFPMFFSDVDWCKRVKIAGYDIVFEPSAVVTHHQGASVRQRRAEMIWASHRSFYLYFKKHERKFPIANEIYGVILLLTALVRAAAHNIRSR